MKEKPINGDIVELYGNIEADNGGGKRDAACIKIPPYTEKKYGKVDVEWGIYGYVKGTTG
jgi:hypothetical protein